MKCKQYRHRRALLAALAAAAWTAALLGTHAAAQTDNKDDIVELSPFTVTQEADTGYAATSSMAGTRINTNLKDIPASISAVTKEMMGDLGVHNASQLLTYTLGTEVSGAAGSFSGAAVAPGTLAQDSVDRSFLPGTRVRGLAAADNTRNFFATSIPWDDFNTERVEINRGPNAMLFGSGSPAGIINQATVTPLMRKNKTTVELDYGQFGSGRAQVDANYVLIKDKLAVRTALKYSDDRFMQEEAYIRDKRGYIAGEYKPFPLTTVRVNYEQGRQRSVKPEWRPPFDLGITSWFDLGKPAYDPTTGKTTLTGTWNHTAAPVGAINPDGSTNYNVITYGLSGYGMGSDNPALILTQPNQIGIVGAPLYTNAFAGGLTGLQLLTNRNQWGQGLGGLPASREYRVVEHAGQVGGNNWNEQTISDPAIFDFYHHLLEGPNKPEGAIWHNGSISLEQLLPNHNGGIEFVYNRETVRSSFTNPFNWESYGIGIDVNTKLLDGSTNPNFGRPVMASDSWSTETLEKRSNKRATAFYTLSLEKTGPAWLGKLLGTHTLTANWSDADYYTVTNGGRALVAGPEWVLANPNVATHLWSSSPYYTIDNGASRGFQTVAYLGNAATGNSPQGLNIQPVTANVLLPGVTAAPIMFYNPTANAWQQTGITINQGSEFNKSAEDVSWTGGAVKSETTSKVVILHSQMLDDVIIPTLGYREDSLKFWNAPSNIYLPGNYSEAKAPLPPTPTSTETEHAFNWGTVARLPHSLQAKLPFDLDPGLFYNKSDNFSPTGQRVNIFGQPIDPSKGKTKEYGFMVNGFGNKLALRYTHFETALTGVSQDRRDAFHTLLRSGAGVALGEIQNPNSTNRTQNAAAANAFMTWYNSDPLAAQLRKVYGDNFGTVLDGIMLQTADTVSKGDEFELTYNPTKAWRIAANFSKEQVQTENSSSDAFQLLNQIAPVLQGPAGQVWVNGTTHQTWQQESQLFVNTIDSDVAQNGQTANPELRQYHFNMLTNYSFQNDFLKGFSIGGALRHSSKVLIGTGYVYSSQLGRDVPNYSHQFYGPAETNVDGWVSYWRGNVFKHVNMTIQLNVRNIGVGKKLIPVVAQPDGSVAQWRIAEPMTWTLSTKFEF